MTFLDRTAELSRLSALSARQASGLVVLWGRRRVGKTRLLVEWCRRHGGLYTVADQSAEPVQRRYFADAVAARLPGFNDSEYPAWLPLLRRLSREARAADWRGPVVIDEFPCLAVSSPTLPGVLQNWIDQESSSGGLLVAIAGSSQRMMQGLELDADAPLYGRAVEAFPLQPMPAGWIGPALGLSDAAEMVRAYAVWGGIPRYWELARPFGSDLARSVDALVLDPMGPLHREPDRLLSEETPPASALRPLLDVIGSGANRLSEIAGRLGQPATSLSRPLGRLVDLGLVQREVPFGENERESRRAVYRIADPFFRFWFRVVAPNRALLASAPARARLSVWRRFSETLESAAWEGLCRSALPRLATLQPDTSPATGRPATRGDSIWMPGRRWWHGEAPEWDVISSSPDGRATLAGEVKWSTAPLRGDAIDRTSAALLRRPWPSGLSAPTHYVLFVPRTAERVAARPLGVRVIDADAVMRALR